MTPGSRVCPDQQGATERRRARKPARTPSADSASTVLPGYSTLAFYASRKIDNEWTARVKLENAFNCDYQLAYGYNTPGRGIYATLQYQPK
mgnify:CR=1 FL=1